MSQEQSMVSSVSLHLIIKFIILGLSRSLHVVFAVLTWISLIILLIGHLPDLQDVVLSSRGHH